MQHITDNSWLIKPGNTSWKQLKTVWKEGGTLCYQGSYDDLESWILEDLKKTDGTTPGINSKLKLLSKIVIV